MYNIYKMSELVSNETVTHVIHIEEANQPSLDHTTNELSNETCMFCLESVPSNRKPRPCTCVVHYHEYCYLTWVASYGTTCPLCRKTPIAVVNKDTLELEFELVDNGHRSQTTGTIEEYGTVGDNTRHSRNKHRAILCFIVISAIGIIVLMILIFMRIYNI
jgi:hypothetical protein